MNAQEAAKIVDSGSYEGQDLDVLYQALQNDSRYSEQVKKLLLEMEYQLTRNRTKLYEAAIASSYLDEMNEEVSLDEDSMRKLEHIDFTETKSINGKTANVMVNKAQGEKVRKMIEDAARIETMSELRGMTSPESKAAQAFRAAGTIEEKRAIFEKTLHTNIDCAIVNMVLGADTYKRYAEGKAKCKNEDEAKAYLKNFANSLGKEVQSKFALVQQLGKKGEIKGKKGIVRIRLGMENAAAYCSGVWVRAGENLQVYKKNIADRIAQIDKKVSFLAGNGLERVKKNWDQLKSDNANLCDANNKRLAQKLERLEQNGKVVFGKVWDVTKKVAQAAWNNRRQILADTGAAMAYSAALGVGGSVALGAGVAYAGYTVWRRVIKPWKEQKKSGKPLDAKFWVKAAAGVGAAWLSFDIANHIAGMQNLADTALTQAAAEVAKARAARIAVATGGAVAGNAAGAVQAAISGDKKAVKSELKQLAFTAALSGLTVWATSYIGGDHGAETETPNHRDTPSVENSDTARATAPVDSLEMNTPSDTTDVNAPVDSLETRATADSVALRTPVDSTEMNTPSDTTDVNAPADTTDHATPVAEEQNSGAQTAEYDDYPWDFPDHNPEDSGITDKQFENLRKIIMSHADGDETVLDRMYHNAAANAEALSPDPNNPLTPEQVLFKFFRAGAWTAHEGGKGWGWVESGALKGELSAIWKAIGCGDEIDAAMLGKVKVLMGSVDKYGHLTNNIFESHPEFEKDYDFDEQGRMLGYSNKVLVGSSGDCHDGKLHWEEAAGREKVIDHTEEAPQPVTEPKTEVVHEPVARTSLGDREIVHEENAAVAEQVKEVVTEEPQKQEINIPVGVLHDESSQAGINGADVHERVSRGEDVGDVAAHKAALKGVARRMASKGALTQEELRALQEKLSSNTK